MFEQTFVQSQAQTRKPWTVVVSLSLQCVVIAILLLISLLHTETLPLPGPPQPHLLRTWIMMSPPPAPRAHANATAISAPMPAHPFVYQPPNAHAAPGRTVDIPLIDSQQSGWPGPMSAAFGPPLPAFAVLPPAIAERPPAPSTAPRAAVTGPLRISEGVQGAKLLFSPHPSYPQLARATRSQGVVKLEAIIGADGSIRDLRVLAGPPLLVNAARDAVQQWRYQPTLLNGLAVEVLTEIDVNFSLSK